MESEETIDQDPGVCQKCGAERDGHSHVVLYGDWDAEQNGFSRPPGFEPLCRSCWHERYNRVAGAHYEVEDGQRLWEILQASQGDLAADLGHIFVGGAPVVRVVDDDLQMATTKPKRVDENTIRFDAELVESDDHDREWLVDLFDTDAELPDDGMPTIAVLRPVEETVFGDVRERGGDSQKLTRWSNGE